MTLFAIYDGDGSTAEAPKIVETADGLLEAFAEHTEYGDVSGFYKQAADIDFTGREFVPLAEDEFKGLYDGGGHTISGININITNPEGYNYYGLFGRIYSDYSIAGGVKNLTVKGDINISGGSNLRVGLLAGMMSDGFIENCAAIGTITVNGEGCEVGLLAGYCEGVKYIKNCYAVGTVTAQGYAGGIIGYKSSNPGYITDCFAMVDVTGRFTGGIAGYFAEDHIYVREDVVPVNIASLGAAVSASGTDPEAGRIFGKKFNKDEYVEDDYPYPTPIFYNSAMTVSPAPTEDEEFETTAVSLSDTQVYVSDTDNWWAQNMHFVFGTSEAAPWQWDAENKRPKLWFEK